MPSSSESQAPATDLFSSITPSQLDPRFEVNRSMAIVQDGVTRAFGFSYVDATSGRQVTEWVFHSAYVMPPAAAATAEVPTQASHDFSSVEQWQAALVDTGSGAIWQTDSIFSRSWVSTYRGVPSSKVSDYAKNEEWPVVPETPGAANQLDQIDPGRAYAPSVTPPAPLPASTTAPGTSVQLKADICVVTAAGAGHPDQGNTNARTAEFWTLFDDYLQPTTQQLAIEPGPTPGVTAVTLEAYLAYWNVGTNPEKPVTLCVETCSRSQVNPYAN